MSAACAPDGSCLSTFTTTLNYFAFCISAQITEDKYTINVLIISLLITILQIQLLVNRYYFGCKAYVISVPN